MSAWAAILALPGSVYHRDCQSSDKLVLMSTRLVEASAKAANAAEPATAAPEVNRVGDLFEAPSAASPIRVAIGAVKAAGTNGALEVWCLLVDYFLSCRRSSVGINN